jgi:tetratricopeptide (TPR) repeat protein
MAFRTLCITGFALLAALPMGAANPWQTQPGSHTDTTQSVSAKAPEVTSATSAPKAPTLAEMRAMTAEELDEAGDRMRSSKDYLSALDCYREAVRKRPAAGYYNKIAISELMLRHTVEAEKAARKAVRKDKTMAEAWNNLGVAYYMHHQLGDSIRTYERAISLNPSSASFHNNLAAARMDSGQFERGMAEYRRAFALDPGFFERSSESGISARMGSPQDRAQFSFVMARLFASIGEPERALHFLRSAMEEGYPKIDDVYRDKDFEPMRNDERFLALMKERPVAIR